MKIYIDFNGTIKDSSDARISYLNLTGYGTLASLSLNKIKLKVGEKLIFNDPDGLSVEGVTFFDKSKVSDNCSGWFAKINADDITQGQPSIHDYDSHICFTCRKNIKPYLISVGQQFKENCPFCNTSVMFPLSQPE